MVEGEKHIPFEIKRMFYIVDCPDHSSRAAHAHRKSRQAMITAKGSCEISLEKGEERHTYRLQGPNLGVITEPFTWIEIGKISSDCVIIVLASDHYDPSEYISDYAEFKQIV